MTWYFLIPQEMQLHAASNKDLCLVSVDNEVVHLLPCVTTKEQSNAGNKIAHISSSIIPKHQAAISNQKLSLDFSEENIFQQWKFDYSFNWKRRRRRWCLYKTQCVVNGVPGVLCVYGCVICEYEWACTQVWYKLNVTVCLQDMNKNKQLMPGEKWLNKIFTIAVNVTVRTQKVMKSFRE